mmetsp:Transcript_34099/g.69628  ORF Transcript_34099/g.69628 Transcript_34099/m.69628 type:complete len:82 (+) Transcript_34099:237-482(+)
MRRERRRGNRFQTRKEPSSTILSRSDDGEEDEDSDGGEWGIAEEQEEGDVDTAVLRSWCRSLDTSPMPVPLLTACGLDKRS